MAASPLPPELEAVRQRARHALKEVDPAGPCQSRDEDGALFLASRTKSGGSLPEYYLVYFLLVDLLGYEDLGQSEKVAWAIPVRYKGRLYSVEHRKFGIGIFAPNLDPAARTSGTPSAEAESDAREIAAAINRAVSIAEPYFAWRAEQAAATSNINVTNASDSLFDRYVFFRNRFNFLEQEEERIKDERNVYQSTLADASKVTTSTMSAWSLRREASWNAQAAIDAFFSWSEHSFIHLAILRGLLCTGDAVAALAADEWKAKFKAALDLTNRETKQHYDTLLELRVQIRNFMAHGAFGKRGEAFLFHSGAGAVPVLLTRVQDHRYSITGLPAFDEGAALAEIDRFIEHLWSGSRAAAKIYIFSSLPSILTYATDGTYALAMQSEEDMREFVEHLTQRFDDAANKDW